MAKYYFLSSILTPIEIGQKPEISFGDLVALLEMNLTSSDLRKLTMLKKWLDIKNLRAMWAKEPIDTRGSLSDKELDEALLEEETLPDYVFEFMQEFESDTDRLQNFSSLFAQFFCEAKSQAGFLGEVMQGEWELELTLAAIRSKEFGRDISKELQFEDSQDPFVAHILAQKDLDHYAPPQEYLQVKELYTKFRDSPIELHKALLEFRLNRLIEFEETRPFSIDQVLAYTMRLMLVEDWNNLSSDKGKQILGQIA